MMPTKRQKIKEDCKIVDREGFTVVNMTESGKGPGEVWRVTAIYRVQTGGRRGGARLREPTRGSLRGIRAVVKTEKRKIVALLSAALLSSLKGR